MLTRTRLALITCTAAWLVAAGVVWFDRLVPPAELNLRAPAPRTTVLEASLIPAPAKVYAPRPAPAHRPMPVRPTVAKVEAPALPAVTTAPVIPMRVLDEGQCIHQGHVGRWVEVIATAYSPNDPIDQAYAASKGSAWRWITADGKTDVREKPYGIAVPYHRGRPLWVARGTKLIIPDDSGYLSQCRDDRVFIADDTGSMINRNTRRTGVPHIDLRFKHTASALAWSKGEGKKKIKVFVIED